MRLIDRLKSRPLLDGVRGAPAADVDALADALVRLSVLAADLGDLMDALDVNPVIVSPRWLRRGGRAGRGPRGLNEPAQMALWVGTVPGGHPGKFCGNTHGVPNELTFVVLGCGARGFFLKSKRCDMLCVLAMRSVR